MPPIFTEAPAWPAFAFALGAGLGMPLLLGWPLAVILGYRSGLRSLGMGAALGLSLFLVAARAAQMVWPIAVAAPWLLFAAGLTSGTLWGFPAIRRDVAGICRSESRHLRAMAVAMILLVVGINAPALFHGAIQFDGSRNADSLTFTTNARYALWHAFRGAPDYSPSSPIFTIARGYFGDGAMQPRPAAETFLAWLSGIWGTDPMYLYNGLQTAGVLLAGLAVFAFLAADKEGRSRFGFAVSLVLAMACPSLLFLAINSNFANAMTLAAATGYVALGIMPRRRGSFVAAVMFLACLLSGYPEVMVFVGAVRGFAAISEGVLSRTPRATLREIGFLGLEVVVACLVVPWGALGAWSVYVTSAAVSHAGASDLKGHLYAGMPLAVASLVVLCTCWKDLGDGPSAPRARSLFVGVLMAFGLAQLAMCVRGFGYGGMKLSEYYVTSMCGLLLVCSASAWTRLEQLSLAERLRQLSLVLTLAIAAIMGWRDARMFIGSWRVATDRQVTRDLVAMGGWVREHEPNQLIAMGKTPAPFYYGQWVPYVIDAHFVYDWNQPEQAGYLEPYLRQTDRARYSDAMLLLTIDRVGAVRSRQANDVAVFGRVHLQRTTPWTH